MKLTLLILAVVACVLARPGPDDDQYNNKQKDVWDVLKYLNNPMYHKEHAKIAQSYSVEQNAHHYKNEAYQYFSKIYPDRFLKKGEIFSIFNNEHVHQAKALFKLFYYADTYETFHQTALWARYHLNEGLFMYTYSVAIVHRPDTLGLALPPIYEIYPHYFFNSEVMQQAYKLKMGHYNQEHHYEGSQHNQAVYTIYSNYSGHYLNLDPEQSFSYYLEDVGINAFYFYFNLYHPYWMNSEEFHFRYSNRGELFYYLHKQLYARYHLERLSHGVGDVEFFNWELPFKTGYYPSLTYPNGLSFPERPHFANLKEYIHYYGQKRCDPSKYEFGYTYVQTYEQRIREAIDSGFVTDSEGKQHNIYTAEGINVLGNMIEGNTDSPNHHYYGSYINFARHLLGYSKSPLSHHKLAPSALEHYVTSLRDPAFYQICKKMGILVDQYKQYLPAYQHKHLYQEHIEVEHVEFEPLVTYYDHFYSDITNGLYVTPEEYETDSFRVRVHQYRLNHKNFNYKVHIKSQKNMPVAVKVFLGPKYDEHGREFDIGQIHNKAMEFDYFVYEAKVGENVITRNSADFKAYVKDQTSYYDVYRHIMQGKNTEVADSLKHEFHYGFPLRFKLPRGSEEGTTFQIYVIVYPYVETEHNEYHQKEKVHHPFYNYLYYDQYPLGYPFDRPVEDEAVYHVQNAYLKHVKVYHQVNRGINHEGHHDYQHQVSQYGEDYVNQHGDHNNYQQYHYQKPYGHQGVYEGKHYQYQYQNGEQEAHYENQQGQKYQQYGEQNIHHETQENHMKYVKAPQTSTYHYKPFFQSEDSHSTTEGYYHQEPKSYSPKYQHYYYGKFYYPGKFYEQKQSAAYEHQTGEKYAKNAYANYQKYHDVDYPHYGEQYTPSKWSHQVKYGDNKAYHAFEHQTVADEHHYGPYHHYYTTEEQD